MTATMLEGRPLLVLSPHLDDAAFSASALLESPLVEVWTVFAGEPTDSTPTEWDERCGYDNAQQLIRDRRAEDARALSDTNHRQLDFAERAYTTPQRRAMDLSNLRAEVRGWISLHPEGIIALPAGAGGQLKPSTIERLRKRQPGVTVLEEAPSRSAAAPEAPKRERGRDLIRKLLHADYLRRRRKAQRAGMLANEDHLQLRDVVMRLAAESATDVLLYEELPYLWSLPADDAASETAARHGRGVNAFTLTPDLPRKCARVKSYITQLEVMDPVHRRLDRCESLPTTERYWLLPHGVITFAAPQDKVPEASVVIAVYNGADVIGEQLTALANQVDTPPFEVLVVDNRSTDDLSAACAPFGQLLNLRMVAAPDKAGQAYARNVGAAAARSDALLFCDDDDIVSETWVGDLTRRLNRDDVLVTGPLEMARLNPPIPRSIFVGGDGTATRIVSYPTQGYLSTAWGGNLGVRRGTYLEVGGMDNSYQGGDEGTDFSWRVQEAGRELVVVDTADVHVRLRTDSRSLFRQRRGYARARVLTVVRSASTARPLQGMSFKWAIRQMLRLPLGWLRSRKSEEERFKFAHEAGSVVGNLEGQIRYRILRKLPEPELIHSRD